MKSMTKNFSKKEKLLFAVLAIGVLILLYYRLFYVNISEATASARSDAAELQTELDFAEARATRIENMKSEMQGYKTTGAVSRMGSYNSSKQETAFLHTVLDSVSDYNIAFDAVTRDGNQIRRGFTLQFSVPDYKTAEAILYEMTHGEYRCMIGDMNCSSHNGAVTVSLNGTFFETLVGGAADSALPADEEAINE